MKTPNQVVKDPELFAAKFLKIRNKDKELVPLKWNRAQRHFNENRTGRDIILKARQLGFSTYVQGEMFRRTVTGTRTTITLAHDNETTQILRRMADRYYENCKFGEVQPARKYSNAALATYPEFDSEAIISTAGSKEKGRGGSYTDFHGSEVAFWPDAEKLVAGAMQGGNPDVILESTPNGARGYFYERCMEALNGDGVWRLHFYPWWWDDEYRVSLDDGETLTYTEDEAGLIARHGLQPEQIKWRRLKQKELKELFKQEYPEDPLTCFLTSGDSYFGDTSKYFTAPLDVKPILPKYSEHGELIHRGHQYSMGLDFAQTVDFTVLIVIDKTIGKMVDYLRINKMAWKEQRQRIKKIYQKWGGGILHAEANSIGSVNIEELISDGVKVSPFNTTNDSKARIMSALRNSLEDGNLKLQDWDILKHEMNIFVSSQTPSGIWRLAAEEGGHDDTVISLAIAWDGPVTAPPPPQPKQKSKWSDRDVNDGSRWKRY